MIEEYALNVLKLIVAANKLLKESFTLAKSGRPYNETYLSMLPR